MLDSWPPPSRCSFSTALQSVTILVAGALLPALPVRAHAQTADAKPSASLPAAAPVPPPPPAGALTMVDVTRLAEDKSPLVRRAIAERRQVEARDVGASVLAPANPWVSFSGGPRRERVGAEEFRGNFYRLHIEQMLEIAGQRGTRREVVRREVAVAQAREQLARIETRARVRSLFVAHVVSHKLVDSAKRREQLGRQLFDSVVVRLEKGAASEIDMHLAEVEFGEGVRARVEAERAVFETRLALRAFLALLPGTPFEVLPELPPRPVVQASLEELGQAALARRAELAALDRNQAALDAELVRLRRENVPSPLLFVDIERDLPGQLYTGGGVGITLPVFRRNQGERALVRAEKERLDVERDVLERAVQIEVAQAFRAVENLEAQFVAIDKHILPAAEANVNLLTDGWRAGKFDLFRVIQASREAADARRLYLRTLSELWQAHIELARATGEQS